VLTGQGDSLFLHPCTSNQINRNMSLQQGMIAPISV
jgi:hypothetical protein